MMVAEPLQQRHNEVTPALLLGDGSSGNVVQANLLDKLAYRKLERRFLECR
jgi:hypothetical protein